MGGGFGPPVFEVLELHYPAKRVSCLIDISEDDDLSSPVDISGGKSFAIEWPSAMDSATATLYGSNTIDGTYKVIEDEGGNAQAVTITANTIAVLSGVDYENLLGPINFVKLLTVGAETADRTIWWHIGY